MNFWIKRSVVFKSLTYAIVLVLIKLVLLPFFNTETLIFNSLIDFSDISIIFTGTFFVSGILLAGTMTDFKEGEKIPGEVAANLEAIQDWTILACRAPRIGSTGLSLVLFNRDKLKEKIMNGTDGILTWIKSNDKKSEDLFKLLREFNELAFYFAEHGADKESVKGIQENTNVLRKNLTRAYTISRTSFLPPAYTLMNTMLSLIFILLIGTKFKSSINEVIVPFTLTFIFTYLHFLIIGLDNPFDNSSDGTCINFGPIEKFKDRLKSFSFN